MPHLGKAFGNRSTDSNRRPVLHHQRWKTLLDGVIAAAQRVVIPVADFGLVVLVIGDIGGRDGLGQPLQFSLGLVLGQRFDGFCGQFGHGSLRKTQGTQRWLDITPT